MSAPQRLVILTATPRPSRPTNRRARLRGSLRKSPTLIPKTLSPTHARGCLQVAVTPFPSQLPLRTVTAAPRATNGLRTATDTAMKTTIQTRMMIPMRLISRWTPRRTWRVNSAEQPCSLQTSLTFCWPGKRDTISSSKVKTTRTNWRR